MLRRSDVAASSRRRGHGETRIGPLRQIPCASDLSEPVRDAGPDDPWVEVDAALDRAWVELDLRVEELAVALMEETVIDVLACACAEEAIEMLREHADYVAMLFTGTQLAGPLDGIELASLIDIRWPNRQLVAISDCMDHRMAELPGRAVFLGGCGSLSPGHRFSARPSSAHPFRPPR